MTCYTACISTCEKAALPELSAVTLLCSASSSTARTLPCTFACMSTDKRTNYVNAGDQDTL